MSDTVSDLARALDLQGQGCARFGSPFYAGLLAEASSAAAAGDPLLAELFAPWADADFKAHLAAAAPLRMIGALHDIVLSGDDADLAAAFPQAPRDADGAGAWPVARRALQTHVARVAEFMTHEPQTNEVRRSAVLAPGFLTIARETGLPLRCFEIAASAGLNLSWDRYHYDFGDVQFGRAEARVRLDTVWTGPPPPVDAPLVVAERAACDRRPVDLTDPVERRRLLAYVWPDQFERLERIRAAIDLALATHVQVETADAVEWTARKAKPRAGAATILYHSVFWQYMPAESQAALAQVIADLGASATADAPFAWLRMEPPPSDMKRMELLLTMWPGGRERLLADVHPHGAAVDWKA